jgi:hypothetical protein
MLPSGPLFFPKKPLLPVLVLSRRNELDHGLIGDNDPWRELRLSNQRRPGWHKKNKDDDHQVNEDDPLCKSETDAQSPVKPSQECFAEKELQKVAHEIAGNKNEGEKETKADQRQIVREGKIRFQIQGHLGLKMVSEQDAQNHTCKGREFSHETPEKPLHDKEYQRGDDDKIEQIHGEFLSETPRRRQANWSLKDVDAT